MQQTMLPEETRNVRKNRSRVHRWIAGGMSCVMSLCTVLSLVAPAFAQENETAAEPHTHTEACYQQVTEKTGKTLSCDALSLACDGADGETANFVVHAHSGLCYDETGALVCTLPEKEAHTHGDGCYTTADTHIHDDSCYDMDAQPVCDKTAHTHSDACYTCAQEGEEGHTHNDTCRTLTCTAEEHTHEAACYPLTCTQSTESAKLTCTKEEVILHTHGDACYETYTDETGAEQKRLTCTQQEIKEHVHTDACFTTTTEPVDTTALTCTEGHEHTALCYGTWELVCGLEETGPAVLSEEDQAKVQAVIDAVDAMPSADEYDAELDKLPETEDYDGIVALKQKIYDAYDLYDALSEELKAYVTNADKLLELEYVWSQRTLEDTTGNVTIGTVSSSSVNANVKLFNYNNGVNDDGFSDLSEAGYKFFQGNYIEDPSDVKEGSVDGVRGRETVTNSDGTTTEKILTSGDYNNPNMTSTLGTDGYPQTSEGYSFQKYFNSAVAQMSNGGGLFQKSGDYYIYDSASNAAFYDKGTKQFVLYDHVVRPSYTNSDLTDVRKGNFLPFNELIGSGEEKTVTVDDANTKDARLLVPVDLWFGMTVDFEFFMPKDGKVNGQAMEFDFHGDDDVFVYIGMWNDQTQSYDYKLVLDIGGTHGARSGTINFATGAVTDFPATLGDKDKNDKYVANTEARSRTLKEIFKLTGNTFEDYSKLSLKFFYMERGGNISYCRLKFNIPTLPDNSLTVTKELETSDNFDVNALVKENMEYKFRVLQVDSEEKATNKLYVAAGTGYSIYENGAVTGTGTVGEDGYFTLKAGQSAQFTGMLALNGTQNNNYIVEETMPSNLTGQYSGVQYTVGSSVNNTTTADGATTEFTSYQTGVLSAEQAQLVTYWNKIDVEKLGALKITKELKKFDPTGDTVDPEFTMMVTINGEPLEVGRTYTVNNETKTVAVAGNVVLKADQSVTIPNIIAGSSYDVSEISPAGYKVAYENQSGTIGVSSTAEVTVTNEEKGVAPEISVKKILTNPTDDVHTYYFTWVEGTYENGTFTETGAKTPVQLAMEANQPEKTLTLFAPKYTLKMLDGAGSKEFYYKIYESDASGNVLADNDILDADQTVYVVKVTVMRDDSELSGLKASKTVYKMTDKDGTVLTSPQNLESVTFSNTLLGALEIKKDLELLENSELSSDKTFTMQVKVGGQWLTKGTKYTIGVSDYEVGDEGTVVLQAGQTILIENIPAGSTYDVTEKGDSAYGYEVVYTDNKGTITAKSSTVESNAVVITNKELEAKLEIPVLKNLTNPDGKEHTYAFKLTQVDKDGNVLSDGETQNASVTMKEDKASAKFVLTYKGTDLNGESTRTYYYLVKETTKSDLYLDADVSTFLLEVKLSGGDNQLTAKVVSVNKQSVSGETPVLTFTNTLLGTITLEKTLVGATHVGPFTFDLTGKIADGDYYAVRNGEDKEVVTFKNGKATVKLMLNDTLTIYGIPHGTAITIQEYVGADEVRYTINGSIWKHSGYTAETEVTTSGTTVRYINYYYGDLPQTGQLNWPILLLAVLGVGCLGAGAFLRFRRKKGKYE